MGSAAQRIATGGCFGRVEDWRGKPLIGSRFQSPLIEPDMRVSRIRLSDKTSCVRPRTGLGTGFELNEP